MARCIYDTYLPIRLLDCRKNRFNNDITFRGLKKLIEDDKSSKNRLVNERFPISSSFSIGDQQVKATFYGFNKREKSKKNENDFLNDTQAILFTLGQQIQGTMDSRIISNAGLGPIKNSLMVVIEFPDITPSLKKNLFMTDRERLLDKEPKKIIQERIKEILRNEPIIKEFCDERMKGNIDIISSNNTIAKEIAQNLISHDPNMQQFFISGADVKLEQISLGGKKKNLKHEEENEDTAVIELKENPTYIIPCLKLVDEKYIKNIYEKQSFRITLKTDGPVDFFDRLYNQGELYVTINGIESSSYSKTCTEGKINLIFDKTEAKKQGCYNLGLNIECVDLKFTVHYDILLQVEVSNKDEKKGNKSIKIVKKSLSIPNPIPVHEADWPDGMTAETSILPVVGAKGEYYYINMDNKYFFKSL